MKGGAFVLAFVLLLASGSVARAQLFERMEAGSLGHVESSSVSATWADYDGDGDLDVFVTNPLFLNLLYRNDGDRGFTVVEQDLGFFRNAFGAAWGDVDNDGDPDLVVTSLSHNPTLYRNYEGELAAQGFIGGNANNVRDLAFADFDNDGDLDIALARRYDSPDLLVRNDGELGFRVLSDALPGPTDDGVSLAWGDYDGDGDPDLYVLNSASRGSGLNVLYQNTGESFVRAPVSPNTVPGKWQSANWIDFDNDLDLDLYVSNHSGNNVLYRNEGGEFAALLDNVLSNDGTASLGSSWGDVDNDGDLDLVLAVRDGAERVYLGNGAGGFTEEILGGGEAEVSTAASLTDMDGDGRLDVVVTNGGSSKEQVDAVYRNVAIGGHWLNVRPVGAVANRSGIGARIKVLATINGEPRWQLRDMASKSGRYAQQGPWVHFGLGDAIVADSVVIVWPGGDEQIIETVEMNQTLTVYQNEEVSAGEGAQPEDFGILSVFPNPSSQGATFVIAADRSETMRVEVFDAQGRRIHTLLDGHVSPGRLELVWDGRTARGRTVAAGTYIVRMTTGERVDSDRVTIVH